MLFPQRTTCLCRQLYEDQFTGLGWHQDADGNYYAGHWCNHVKFGTGKMIYTDGASYCGLWVDDKPRDGVWTDRAGSGVLFETYIGKLDADGNRDGFGVVKYATAHPDALRDVFEDGCARIASTAFLNFLRATGTAGPSSMTTLRVKACFATTFTGGSFRASFPRTGPCLVSSPNARDAARRVCPELRPIYQNPQPLRKHRVVYSA